MWLLKARLSAVCVCVGVWHKHVAQMKRTKASQSFEASREYNVRRATGISIMTMAPEGEEERHNDDDDDVALDWD